MDVSILGFPDFRSTLCEKQPGKNNIKICIYRACSSSIINKVQNAQQVRYCNLFIYRLESDSKEG